MTASERHERWRKANPERWGEITRAASSAFAKRDRKLHPEKWATIDYEHQANRRARKQGGRVTMEEWTAIRGSFGGCCEYCLRNDLPLTQDHVIPISRGGRHEASNIVPACRGCNCRKHARGPLAMVNQEVFS